MQRLPFERLQQDVARQIHVNSSQKGHAQDAPTDDGKQGCGALEPIEVSKLTSVDTATAFQNAMPRYDGPSTRIPGNPLKYFQKLSSELSA